MASGQSTIAIQTIDDIMDDLVSVYGADHRLTLQAYATRAQAEGTIERYDDAIRDDNVVYKASLAKQGPHAFYTFGPLSDIAVSECRNGHPEVGLQHALQALEASTATFGATNAITQSVIGGSVSFCLIMDKQYAEAARYLNGFNVKGTSDFTADPDNAASISLMRAAIAANTGDLAAARELLRMPLSAYARPTSDRFFHRWALALSQSVADPSAR